MGNFLESLFDALIELVFQKGEKKNRKKSWKQFLKDNREEAKRRDEEIMALPFKEKVIRSSKFIFMLGLCKHARIFSDFIMKMCRKLPS